MEIPKKIKIYKKQNQSRNTKVESIKIFECDNLYVKCEYRPQLVEYQQYQCQFENSGIPQRIKTYSRQKYSPTTEAALEGIKVDDCGNFYMKCEYRPNSETYKYRCKFISSEVITYQLFWIYNDDKYILKPKTKAISYICLNCERLSLLKNILLYEDVKLFGLVLVQVEGQRSGFVRSRTLN